MFAHQELAEHQKAALKKRMRKELYKKDHPVCKPKQWQGLVNLFYANNHGDSHTIVMIFDRSKISLSEFARLITEHFNPHGFSINSDYDCTGRWFCYRMKIRIFKDRIFVAQWHGMDV